MRTISLRAFLVLMIGCGLGWQPAGAIAAPLADRSDGASATLRTRADALNRRDKAAFMATVDESQKQFAAAQDRWYDRFTSLPVKDVDLKLDLDSSPELTRQKDTAHYRTDVLVADVQFRYRIADYDRDPTLDDLIITFARRGDRWLIASDTDTDDIGLLSTRQPWDFDEVGTKSNEHFLLVFHPASEAVPGDLLNEAEASLPSVDKAWKGQWSRRVPIFVPADGDELARMLGGTLDVTNFVAFASSSLDRDNPDRWKLVGTRVLINSANFLAHPEVSRRKILAHELTHVATRDASGPFISPFIEEGLAQLSEGSSPDGLKAKIRKGIFDKRLPEDWEFSSGNASSILNAYQEALSAFGFLQQRFGIDRIDSFYMQEGKARLEPGTPDHVFDKALRSSFGMSAAEFQSQWVDFAQRTAR